MRPSWPTAPTTPNMPMNMPKALRCFASRSCSSVVALQVVADLVAEHRGELRLVLHPQHEPAPHLHHSVGRHRGVEVRRLHEVHAHVGAMIGLRACTRCPGCRPACFASRSANGLRRRRVSSRSIIDHRPPSSLPASGRAKRAGIAPLRRLLRAREARGERRAAGAAVGEKAPAVHFATRERPRAARPPSRPRARLRAGRRGRRAMRLNHTTCPVFRSTSEA